MQWHTTPKYILFTTATSCPPPALPTLFFYISYHCEAIWGDEQNTEFSLSLVTSSLVHLHSTFIMVLKPEVWFWSILTQNTIAQKINVKPLRYLLSLPNLSLRCYFPTSISGHNFLTHLRFLEQVKESDISGLCSLDGHVTSRNPFLRLQERREFIPTLLSWCFASLPALGIANVFDGLIVPLLYVPPKPEYWV